MKWEHVLPAISNHIFFITLYVSLMSNPGNLAKPLNPAGRHTIITTPLFHVSFSSTSSALSDAVRTFSWRLSTGLFSHCQPTSANWRKLCFFDLSSPNWSPANWSCANWSSANWRISASWKLFPRVIETWPPHFPFSNLGGLPASLCAPLSKL